MKTLLEPACYARLVTRFRSLPPDARPRWGRLTAPRMLAHLIDQIRYTLGEMEIPLRSGVLRWPLVKQAVMYWLPWPRERIRAPPQMFSTPPTTWQADLAAFESLLDRFVSQTTREGWPEHPFFGRMTRQSWGRFCYRHIDYHLRQFGA